MAPSTSAKAARPSPRERLLAAADELFYADGVHSVGIDRVLERAGVAKASMYTAFAGKEELIAAYLGSRHDRILARINEAVERQSDARARLLAVFDAQAGWVSQPSYRGCAFARASAEAPAGGLVQRATDDYRNAVLGILTRLAADAGVADAATVGRQLQLLYHGTALLGSPEQRRDLAAASRSAAETLLDMSLARSAGHRAGPR